MSQLPRIQKISACLPGEQCRMQLLFLSLPALWEDWCGVWANPVSLGIWRRNSFGLCSCISAVTQMNICGTRTLGNKESWVCEGVSGSMVGLPCLPASYPCGRHKTAQPKKCCKQARQGPSDAAAADILCPLVFPSQLSLILWFVNSMETGDTEPAWILLQSVPRCVWQWWELTA